MVYSNHHLAKRLFAIILAFAFVICFVPTISEASYGAASSTSKQTSKKSKARKTVPKPGVLNLYVNTEVSQKAVPAKKKRRHYRRVQLTWSPSGKATTYIVYGTWNTKVKGNAVLRSIQSLSDNENISLNEAVETLEKNMIEEALRACGSTRKVAEKLKVNQSTIVRKMQKYDIKP